MTLIEQYQPEITTIQAMDRAYATIRIDILARLLQWRDEGIRSGLPGHFLQGVLANDLRETLMRADLENRPTLYGIMLLLHNHMPSLCWNSPYTTGTDWRTWPGLRYPPGCIGPPDDDEEWPSCTHCGEFDPECHCQGGPFRDEPD